MIIIWDLTKGYERPATSIQMHTYMCMRVN